jgi:phospholipase C
MTHNMSISSALIVIAFVFCASASLTYAQTPASAAQIRHIVFILKENHTFDNYFGSLPGVDGAITGRIHTGKTVPLMRAPDDPQGDIWHTWHYALLAMDDGKMDRFDFNQGSEAVWFFVFVQPIPVRSTSQLFRLRSAIRRGR